MAKKTAKKKRTGNELAKVEADRARELQTLRRLRRQQTAITEASRAVTRACRRADRARMDAARDLVEGTGYGVFGVDEIGRIQAVAPNLHNRIAELEHELTDIRDAHHAALERLNAVIAERDELRSVRAAVASA